MMMRREYIRNMRKRKPMNRKENIWIYLNITREFLNLTFNISKS
jgi:hypothetical protein